MIERKEVQKKETELCVRKREIKGYLELYGIKKDLERK